MLLRALSSRGRPRGSWIDGGKFWIPEMKLFRFIVPALALGAITPCFAADGDTALTSALTQLQTGVTGMIGQVAPVVVSIVVALLALVGIFFAWKYVRKAIGR